MDFWLFNLLLGMSHETLAYIILGAIILIVILVATVAWFWWRKCHHKQNATDLEDKFAQEVTPFYRHVYNAFNSIKSHSSESHALIDNKFFKLHRLCVDYHNETVKLYIDRKKVNRNASNRKAFSAKKKEQTEKV